MTIIQGGVKISGFVQFTANYVPDPPTALTATWTSTVTNTVSLQFTPPANQGSGPVTSYTAISSPIGFTATVAANTNTIIIPGVPVYAPYVFNMYATNFAGNSALSSTSSNIVYLSNGQLNVPITSISAPNPVSALTAIVTATNISPTPSALVSFFPGTPGVISDAGFSTSTITLTNFPATINTSTNIFTSVSANFDFKIRFPVPSLANFGYLGMGYLNMSTMTYTQAVELALYAAYAQLIARKMINYAFNGYTGTFFRLRATKTGSSLVLAITNDSDVVQQSETVALSAGVNYKLYFYYNKDTNNDTETGTISTDTGFLYSSSVPTLYYTVSDANGAFSITTTTNNTIITGLNPLTSYTFNVSATNMGGTSAVTTSNSITTLVTSSSTAYTFPGTYSWVAPANVTSVSVVAVGGGGGGSNNGGGAGNGGTSYFVATSVVQGVGGNAAGGGTFGGGTGGGFTGTGGGSGGRGGGGSDIGGAGGQISGKGGGGAGGYSGAGGAGSGGAGAGGSGGGGGLNSTTSKGGGGGGVGLFGQGASGGAGVTSVTGYCSGGRGGSGGVAGVDVIAGNGGAYGGGGGAPCGAPSAGGGGGGLGYYNGYSVTPGNTYTVVVGATGTGGAGSGGTGAGGAVRVVWPGQVRAFPSTVLSNCASIASTYAPSTPGITSVTANSGTSISVVYTAPTYQGGAVITSYTAISLDGLYSATTSSASSGVIVVDGLIPLTAYSFAVYASNSYGNSPTTGYQSATTYVASSSTSYTFPGSYTWIAPSDVTSVSVVAVGAGAGGDNSGGASYFIGSAYLQAGGGCGAGLGVGGGGTASGTVSGRVGYPGGNGGNGCSGGGGGAGGYTGAGGAGSGTTNGYFSAGGGGGGGSSNTGAGGDGAGGGGTGLFGLGGNGLGGAGSTTRNLGGGGGSGGQAGGGNDATCNPIYLPRLSHGGFPGGGAGGGGNRGGGGGGALAYVNNYPVIPGNSYTVQIGQGGLSTYSIAGFGGTARGGNGAVRIMWPGQVRAFPSTQTSGCGATTSSTYVPQAPTIGTATANSGTRITITYTAPAYSPAPITSYTAVVFPGGITSTTSTYASGLIVVDGLTPLTSYSAYVYATNYYGNSTTSSFATVSTLVASSSTAYTFPGTYSWIAPANVTSVSAVLVGGGGGSGGSGYPFNNGSQSYFISSAALAAGAGPAAQPTVYGGGGASGGAGGIGTNACGGAAGGSGGNCGSGGGAGGYTGVGGSGSSSGAGSGSTGGGGGGGGHNTTSGVHYGGGGVGLFGLGSNGLGGASNSSGVGAGGGGGSGGLSSSGALAGTFGGGGGGAGGGGGGGGGLTYGNNILVTPGNSYTVVVGAAGGNGYGGAARIVWPGQVRSFPTSSLVSGCGATTSSTYLPSTPSISAITVNSGTMMSIAYTASTYQGGDVVTSYTAVVNPGNITGTTATSASGVIPVYGLTPLTTYSVSVYAANRFGYGAASSVVTTSTLIANGEIVFPIVGTYSWIAPANVKSVSVVAVGGGAGGVASTILFSTTQQSNGQDSYFGTTAILLAGGGTGSYFYNGGSRMLGAGGTPGGGYTGGGIGGTPGGRFGGGAGGYSGNGGSGTGGAGGNGACLANNRAAGGGVGLFGQGASGANGSTNGICSVYGQGGSGGVAGGPLLGGGKYGGGGAGSDLTGCHRGGGGGGGALAYRNDFAVTSGTSYTVLVAQGGAGVSNNVDSSNNGAGGAVRIIWPGSGRSFPSTVVTIS